MSTQRRGMPGQSRDSKKSYARVHTKEEATASPGNITHNTSIKIIGSERETIKLGVYVVSKSPAAREGRRSKIQAVAEQ